MIFIYCVIFRWMNSLMAYVDNYMFMNINGYNLRCSKTILNKRHIRQSCFNFVIHFCHLLVYSHMYISKNTLTNIHTSYGETKKHIAVTFNYRESMVLIIITQDRLDIRFSPHVFLVTWCYLWQNVAILRQSIWIRVWLYVIQSEIL